MAYEFEPIAENEVLDLVRARPRLKQAQLLAIFYPPSPDADPTAPYGRQPDPTGQHPEGGNPIRAPHLELEQHLKTLRSKGLVDYAPKGAAGGWVALAT